MIFQVRHFYLIKLPQIHNLPLRSFLPTHPPGEREKEYQDFTKWKLRVIPLFSKVKDSSFWVLFFNIFYKSIFLLGYRRVDSLEKTLMLGGIGGRWWTGRPGVLRFMGLQRVGYDWATELNWTEPDNNVVIFSCEQQWHSAIYMHIAILSQTPFYAGCHIALNRVPWAMQVLADYLF